MNLPWDDNPHLNRLIEEKLTKEQKNGRENTKELTKNIKANSFFEKLISSENRKPN